MSETSIHLFKTHLNIHVKNPEESWRVPSLSSGKEHKNNLHPKMLSTEVDIYCRLYSSDVFHPLMCKDETVTPTTRQDNFFQAIRYGISSHGCI